MKLSEALEIAPGSAGSHNNPRFHTISATISITHRLANVDEIVHIVRSLITKYSVSSMTLDARQTKVDLLYRVGKDKDVPEFRSTFEQFVINELCTAARVVWHCDLISSAAMLSEGGRRDNSQAIATSEETKND